MSDRLCTYCGDIFESGHVHLCGEMLNPEYGVVMHPVSAKFCAILDEMKAMHLKKGSDYGTDADPLSNVRASEQFGIPAWVGCMVRANDKMKRIQTFASKGVLKNESVEDSLLDLAVYAVIGLVLFREQCLEQYHAENEAFDKSQADGRDADARDCGVDGIGAERVGRPVVSNWNSDLAD